MSLNPTVMQSSIDFAERIFKSRKEHLIGSRDEDAGETSFFYVRPDTSIVAILNYDSIVNKDINIPPREQVNCFNRIMTMGIDAQAVITLSEVWFSTRCPSCGEAHPTGKDVDKCLKCGLSMNSVGPSQNPYANEGVAANLEIHNYDKSFIWISESVSKNGEIVSWKDIYSCEEMEISGSFSCPWKIRDKWMIPHVAKNIIQVVEYFNGNVPEDIKTMARTMFKLIPSNVPILKMPPVAEMMKL